MTNEILGAMGNFERRRFVCISFKLNYQTVVKNENKHSSMNILKSEQYIEWTYSSWHPQASSWILTRNRQKNWNEKKATTTTLIIQSLEMREKWYIVFFVCVFHFVLFILWHSAEWRMRNPSIDHVTWTNNRSQRTNEHHQPISYEYINYVLNSCLLFSMPLSLSSFVQWIRLMIWIVCQCTVLACDRLIVESTLLEFCYSHQIDIEYYRIKSSASSSCHCSFLFKKTVSLEKKSFDKS